MKALIRIGLASILALSFARTAVQAQSQPVYTTAKVPAIAFVKARHDTLSLNPLIVGTRDTLFLKRADSTPKAILYSTDYVKVTNLAALDETSDGSQFLIAGSFYYTSPIDGSQSVYTGLLSVPSNINLKAITDISGLLGKVHLLKAYTLPGGAFRPTGKITPDGHWIAIMSGGTTGNNPPVVFYRGHMDQNEASGNIDSALAQTPAPPNISDYHISNVAINGDGTHAIAVLVNQANTLQAAGYLFLHWNLSAFGLPVSVRGPVQITHNDDAQDSIFGVTVRIAPSNDAVGEVALMDKASGSINFWQWPYNNSGNVSLQQGSYSIPRSAIPSDQFFFAGENRGPYTETFRDAVMNAMSGDMAFTRSGDSAVFITHPQDDQNSVTVRNQKTGIYIFNGSTAKLIYNDSGAQELQPVFAQDVEYIPHYGGASWNSGTAGKFQQHDTMTTTPLTFTLSDTSAFAPVTITSATITGPQADQFHLVSPPGGFPATIQPNGTLALTVNFTPTLVQKDTATLQVTFQGQTTSSTLSLDLHGAGNAVPLKGVSEYPALAASIEVQPNPFVSSTAIRLTSPEAGEMGIVVRDALGRAIYSSDVRKVGAGETQSFEFDAKSMGLPTGVYYITAYVGDRQASRQVVFVK